MATYPTVSWILPDGGDRPSFSCDGTRIVYQANGSLYVVGADGGEPRLLLQGTRDLMPSRADWSWSPETIVFGGASGGGSTLWLIDSDGSNLRELPGMGGLSHTTYPSWYESGRWIVAMDSADRAHVALWRFSVDGSADPVQLTGTDNFCAGRPSVSPGGEDAPVAFAGTEGSFNQTSNQIWIVSDRAAKQLDREQGRSPNWSPDGRWILFESNRGTHGGNYQIFVAPAPGFAIAEMQPVPLTDPSYFAQHAEWSRQQDRIVVERGTGQGLGVFEVPETFRWAGSGPPHCTSAT